LKTNNIPAVEGSKQKRKALARWIQQTVKIFRVNDQSAFICKALAFANLR
jgi:hypothetical protein